MSESKMKVSILDGVGLYNGESASEALAYATRSAQTVDHLGFERLWFTEHHNSVHQVSTSPDILTVHAAALTRHIRVGSGGIMLPNHSPLRVVENFSILEALHPGRIDLGMGRASGTDGVTNAALRNSGAPLTGDEIAQLLLEMLAFFDREFPDQHPYAKISPSPDKALMPQIFMLASSPTGMQIASQLGLGLAFAGHINPTDAIAVLKGYRQQFRPSHRFAAPYSILSQIVVCADTDEEAAHLAGPAQLQWARWGTGQIHHPPPTLEEAAHHVYTSAEADAVAASTDRFVIGSPERVHERLSWLAAQAEVDELMAVNMMTDHGAQTRSHRLLAEMFDLSASEPGPGELVDVH